MSWTTWTGVCSKSKTTDSGSLQDDITMAATSVAAIAKSVLWMLRSNYFTVRTVVRSAMPAQLTV